MHALSWLTIRSWLTLRLHRNLFTRHFHPLSLQDTFHHEDKLSDQTPLNEAIEIAHATPANLLQKLNTSSAGLTAEERVKRLQQYGLNQVAEQHNLNLVVYFVHAFNTPFNWLLAILASISAITEDTDGAIVIASIVMLSTVLRTIQEFRSGQAAEDLKKMVSIHATVLLNQNPVLTKDISLKEVVPGDIIKLTAGDMIPADCRFLDANDVFISEAVLTGESIPVSKITSVEDLNATELSGLNNLGWMGTNLVSGTATAVIWRTGIHTYLGSIAKKLDQRRGQTNFETGINKLSWLMLRFMAVMVTVIFLINGFSKHSWMDALLFGLSVAVGLTPEMLPMIVTSTLAKGALQMAQKKVIVKRLDAIQNIGAMDILCTDKTGTLTQDKIILERYEGIDGEVSRAVLENAYINSYFQTGLKNVLDKAVLARSEELKDLAIESFKKTDEIPFDFQRKRISILVKTSKNEDLLICKGAYSELVPLCTHVLKDNQAIELNSQLIRQLNERYNEMQAEGLRVIAVAKRNMPEGTTLSHADAETQLTLVGIIGLIDPPKETTASAIAKLKELGVDVKILTGDGEKVTQTVCKQVGVIVEGTLVGTDLETLNDEQLFKQLMNTTICARLTPFQKERIVRVLRQNKKTVGYMGDGINDSPALRAADVGISVESGVDIAKESADIILLEKDLNVLKEGVLEGRRTFVNILKYIKMATSSNFGNTFSVLGASALLPFLPMLPIHLLVQNLLYDFSQIGIPFDNVDEELLQRPRHWTIDKVGLFMGFFGPISSIFDYVTFAVMWFALGANTLTSAHLFQTGWFVEGLISQTLIVHFIRTQTVLTKSKPSHTLILTTLIAMLIGIALPYTPVGYTLDLQPLPAVFFGWLSAIVFAYAVLTQLMKQFFVKHFGWI